MPKIKRHAQRNGEWSAQVALQLLPHTRLTVAKLHDSGEVLLEVSTAKFVKGLYFATEVQVRLSLTKEEGQELFAALGAVLKSKPQTAKRAASPKPKRRASVRSTRPR